MLDELVFKVDNLRRDEIPIPSFSSMTCRLVEKGISVYDVVKENEEEIDQMLIEIKEEGRGTTRGRGIKSAKPNRKRKAEKISPKFCDHCGRSLEKSIRFCDGCGTSLMI
jgi:hypothetical protein